MAPHRYPFELIDSPDGRRSTAAGAPAEVTARLTANAALLRGEGPLSIFLLLELAAQAALFLGRSVEAEEDATGPVLLAGVEEMSLVEDPDLRPPGPGDTLILRGREEARFARLIKLRVEIDRDGRRLAEAVLLLAG